MSWRGPYKDGVTFSMISKFITCRERFFIYACEGRREPRTYNHTMAYGSIFHGAEEMFRQGKNYLDGIRREVIKLNTEYPEKQDENAKWSALCKYQFPLYMRYHKDDDELRTNFATEEAFDLPYTVPSGRTVRLRGKIDSALQSKVRQFRTKALQAKPSCSIQENKTKGKIDWSGIVETFSQYLQVQFYYTAFKLHFGFTPKRVIYNVIRRPLSEQYSVRQKKLESLQAFIKRACAKMEKEPYNYFYRANDDFSKTETACQYGINAWLEQLCDWWDQTKNGKVRPGPRWHSQYPFGHYHSIAAGFRGDYHDYLSSNGRKDNLEDVVDYFPELEEDGG